MTMLAEQAETRGLTLADYEARIHLYKEQIGTGYIGIGRTLNEAKAARVVPHGQWEQWVTETTGLTPRQAQRCMQAATEIKDGSAMARLEMSKALLLLSSGLDDEQREEIAGRAAEDGATVKALREEIRQAKVKLVQETGAATEAHQALRRLEADKADLEQRLKATVSGYQRRMEEEVDRAYRRGMDENAVGLEKEIRKEYQGKIGDLEKQKGKLIDDIKQAGEREQQLKAQLRDAENKGFNAGTRLMDEQEEQHQRELRELNDEMEEAVAELKKDRADLLTAAEEAEKRAADAEAALEELRASGAGQPEPAWKTLKVAMTRFFADCELMPMYPEDLAENQTAVEACLSRLECWAGMMRRALGATVQAEGAVK